MLRSMAALRSSKRPNPVALRWQRAVLGRRQLAPPNTLFVVPVRDGHSGAQRRGKPTGGSTPKRARRGLYGGKVIQSGNHVSFSVNRNRRTWKPNVHPQSLFSEVLGTKLRVRATTAILRTIDKYGGLDNYLLHTPDVKLQSDWAVETKRLIEAQVRLQDEMKLLPAGAQRNSKPWTEDEDSRLMALCDRPGGTRRSDWQRKALLLGTGRTAGALKARWIFKLGPKAVAAAKSKRRQQGERMEWRLAQVQEQAGISRKEALQRLRRYGNPEARYGKGGQKGDWLVQKAVTAYIAE